MDRYLSVPGGGDAEYRKETHCKTCEQSCPKATHSRAKGIMSVFGKTSDVLEG